MVLLTHITIALLSVALSTYSFFQPTKTGLRVCYGLISATLISGTYLVFSTHSPLLEACSSGLIYVTVVSLIIIPARKKLAAEVSR